jgi:hypothetical protein
MIKKLKNLFIVAQPREIMFNLTGASKISRNDKTNNFNRECVQLSFVNAISRE